MNIKMNIKIVNVNKNVLISVHKNLHCLVTFIDDTDSNDDDDYDDD